MHSYKPYVTTVDPSDTVFDDYTIAKVEPQEGCSGWFVTSTESWACFVPRLSEDAPEPQVGDHLRLYGGLGSEIQGQVLNGRVLWYRTAEQRKQRRAEWLLNYARERREQFDRERDELDARYAELPEPFKLRIDRFRAESPDFRVDSEAYETFCLQQAALLADHFQDETRIREWEALSYAEQMASAPEGWSDQHSGNTYAGAVRFSIALLRGESV